uniref:Mitoferrin-1 n=1 Tax=Monodelphis domestica TaxID=13616 RepID=A0A5F8G8T5_MONDO
MEIEVLGRHGGGLCSGAGRDLPPAPDSREDAEGPVATGLPRVATCPAWGSVSGASGSRLFCSLFLPLQTRMQSLHPDPKARYTSVYGALKQIIRTEGFWRPLRGINVMVMGAGPAHAMYFACYENMKRILNEVLHRRGNSHLANGILKAFVCSAADPPLSASSGLSPG